MTIHPAHSGVEVAQRNSYSIIECTTCNFTHAKIHEENEPKDLYTSHFYSEEKPNYIEDNMNDSEWWDLTYGSRVNQVDKLRLTESRYWLDIGTGPGYFLDSAVKRSKQVVGIEPGVLAAGHASSKGHNVINDYFSEETSSKLGKFDAIHCSEVLEHVSDPIHFLKTIQLNMDSETILCIVVPNDFSLIQEIFIQGENTVAKWWVDPPFHLNYFSKETLRGVLERSGLAVIHETSMFPIDLFLLMGDNYVGNQIIGKQAHQRRKNLEFSFYKSGNIEILNSLYEQMTKLGIGRELVFFSKLADK
ncbi:AdoMet_MTases domain containing protein [Candidatus Nanopelagicaceae bacterium]